MHKSPEGSSCLFSRPVKYRICCTLGVAWRTRHMQCALQVTEERRLLCGLRGPHVQHVVRHGVCFHLRYTRL